MGDNPDEISENMNEVETEVPVVTSTEIDEESQVKQPETSTVTPVKNVHVVPLSVPVLPTSDVKVEEGTSPPKPRKLVSLQYNFSDDEDDETREDRKCRIVSMKSIISPV